jgi:endonuclease YncB( thermonuclease family)
MILAALALVAAGQHFDCRVVAVHDGDTMRCADGTRVRLQGIDANELDGTCHHECANGSADRARAHLKEKALGKLASCTSTGRSYRRVTAWCTVKPERGRAVDLSCEQVARDLAVIWAKFDPHHRLERCRLGLPPLMVAP